MSHLYNEINPYRARVLRARIAEGRLPGGTVDERSIADIPAQEFCAFEQIHLFAGIGGFPLGLRIAGVPEHGLRVITGGFPCQDISNAGKRAGITGERSGLWREMVRAIRVVRPDLVFVENVAALLGRGMGTVVGDLAAIGYDARWTRVSAAEVGAWHLRERIWIMAHLGSTKRRPSIATGNHANGHNARWKETSGGFEASGESEPADAAVLHGETLVGNEPHRDVSSLWSAANAHGRRLEANDEILARQSLFARSGEADADDDQEGREIAERRAEIAELHRIGAIGSRDWWAAEPPVDRMVYGVPARVDRLAALGDAIVPQACAEAIRRLMA